MRADWCSFMSMHELSAIPKLPKGDFCLTLIVFMQEKIFGIRQ